jgi:predicted DNA-binding protein (UPF0251 family)
MLQYQQRNRQGRPRRNRFIAFHPKIKYFKPQGIPLRNLEEIILTKEEIEALRLKNIQNFDQITCAKKMKTSQSTYQRILSAANQKLSKALIEGKAIKIED